MRAPSNIYKFRNLANSSEPHSHLCSITPLKTGILCYTTLKTLKFYKTQILWSVAGITDLLWKVTTFWLISHA
jgi:hypothetical protein